MGEKALIQKQPSSTTRGSSVKSSGRITVGLVRTRTILTNMSGTVRTGYLADEGLRNHFLRNAQLA